MEPVCVGRAHKEGVKLLQRLVAWFVGYRCCRNWTIPEGGIFGTGEIWNGKIWHNKIVPNFAMVFKNSCQILPTPNFAMPVTKFSVRIFLRNLGNFLLLCLLNVLLWYAVPCPVSDGGNSLHVPRGPMASSRYALDPILHNLCRLCW